MGLSALSQAPWDTKGRRRRNLDKRRQCWVLNTWNLEVSRPGFES